MPSGVVFDHFFHELALFHGRGRPLEDHRDLYDELTANLIQQAGRGQVSCSRAYSSLPTTSILGDAPFHRGSHGRLVVFSRRSRVTQLDAASVADR